jgi:two-component system sensor histidine kinase DesK
MLWSLNSGNDTLGSFIDYSKCMRKTFKKTKILLLTESENVVSETMISTEQKKKFVFMFKRSVE